MKIQNKSNKGLAEVDDEFGKKLIEAGEWKAYRRTPVKAQQKPAEDTNNEE